MFFRKLILTAKISSLAIPALVLAAPAQAQSAVALQSDVRVERTVTDEGEARTVLAAPEDVVPGDRLVFSTQYRNDSGDVVENFVVTNPLPAAVVLADDDGLFEVSVDGGASFAPLAKLTVETDTAEARPALPSDVTHIRWTLARLEPGESGSLTYNAFVR